MSIPKEPLSDTPESAVPPQEPSFGEILNQFEEDHAVQPGESQSLVGTVVSVSPETILVDVGRKREGSLRAADFLDAAGAVKLKPGDTLPVTITGRDENGYYRLAALKVEVPKDWSGLEKAFREQATITATVTEAIKGGLRVDVGVRAFMPASRSGARDLAEMQKLVGQEIQCRIIQLDTEKEDVVVDRRVVLEEQARKARQEAFASLREGDVVRGTVRSLTDYGAFVNLGHFDGLLHVGDMSWTRINKPSDLLKPGDSVEVKILKINADTQKISLGMKQLSPDPWSLAEQNYKVGERVRGKVVRLTDFGAFVEIGPGVEGLIHISELSWSKKIRKPSEVLQVGEMVEVIVLSVNAADRRIALGLKQALGDPWATAADTYKPGTVVEKPVASLTDFGAFLELEPGLEGMIHISDITAEKRLQHPREALSVGQVVRAVVLEVDSQRRRMRLGMKQLEPTAVDKFIAELSVGEEVSGRILDTGGDTARVELDDGVIAFCRLPRRKGADPEEPPAAGSGDIGALSAMLAAKWKQGGSSARQTAGGGSDFRGGQVRRFRVTGVDAAKRRIELEPAN